MFQDAEFDAAGKTLQVTGDIEAMLQGKRLAACFHPLMQLSVESVSGSQDLYALLPTMVDQEGSMIAPDTFQPRVRELALDRYVDRWVLREAFVLKARRARARKIVLLVPLNRGSLVDKGLVEWVDRNTRGKDVKPIASGIVLTVKAEDFMATQLRASTLLETLKQRFGFRLALVDIASASVVKLFNNPLGFNWIGISSTLKQDLVASGCPKSVTQELVVQAHAAGSAVILPGIEDAKSLMATVAMNIDFVEGSLIGVPRQGFPLDAG